MRLRSLALTAAAALVATAVAGCATDGGTHDGSAAPTGVSEQYEVLAAEVAERGGSTTSGDWQVSYIVEQAEPWFHAHDGDQQFREPTGTETHHIEIIPVESASGRIVPDVPITLDVIDESGTVVDSQKLNFYYSTFFHYANNFSVPAEGTYTLRAELGAPDFLRHGEQADDPALSDGTTVEFTNVSLVQG